VNSQDHKGKTALRRAARSGFIETMNILLEHGASASIEDPAGETPLFDAIRSTIKDTDSKQEAVIRLLLKEGADALHTNTKGETPLSTARSGKRPEMKKIARILARR
jgi:hypothetical protein